MKSYLFFFALVFLINFHRYCQAVDDVPGNLWNSITQSMSEDEIEQLKKMAMPFFPQIADMATSSTKSHSVNQKETVKKELSQLPGTVARRKRLEKLKINDKDAYAAFRKANVARELLRRKKFTPEQVARNRERSRLSMQKLRAKLILPGNEEQLKETKQRSRQASNRYNAKMKQKQMEKQNKQ